MNTAIVTAILSLFAVAAAPEPSASGTSRGGGRHRGDLCEKLACTDAQKTEIAEIRAELRTDNADERAQMEKLRAQMKTAKSAAKPDAAAIEGLRTEMKALHDKMKAAREASHAEVAALLTPEQKTKLDAMKAERREHGKGKHAGKGKHDGKGKHKAKRDGEGKAKGKNKRADGPRGEAKSGGDHVAKVGLKARGGKGRGIAKRAPITAG